MIFEIQKFLLVEVVCLFMPLNVFVFRSQIPKGYLWAYKDKKQIFLLLPTPPCNQSRIPSADKAIRPGSEENKGGLA